MRKKLFFSGSIPPHTKVINSEVNFLSPIWRISWQPYLFSLKSKHTHIYKYTHANFHNYATFIGKAVWVEGGGWVGDCNSVRIMAERTKKRWKKNNYPHIKLCMCVCG